MANARQSDMPSGGHVMERVRESVCQDRSPVLVLTGTMFRSGNSVYDTRVHPSIYRRSSVHGIIGSRSLVAFLDAWLSILPFFSIVSENN